MKYKLFEVSFAIEIEATSHEAAAEIANDVLLIEGIPNNERIYTVANMETKKDTKIVKLLNGIASL